MAQPVSTRAAVLGEATRLQLRDVRLPDQVEPGAVLVEITCATLCGTDLEVFRGVMPTVTPMVMGHEMVGRAIAVGEGATDILGTVIAVGDRIGWSLATCGACHACMVLREPVLCERRGYEFLQSADEFPYAIGGLARHAYVAPRAAKLRIADDIPDTWAAAAMCTGKTVTRAFERAGSVRAGSTVVVQGAGALGIFATALAAVSGAARVITVGGPDERLDLARLFGATHTVSLDLDAEARQQRVLEITGGLGADYVFDFAGAPGVIAEAVGFAGLRGTVVVVGTTSPEPGAIGLSTIMRKELRVVGSINGDIADYVRAIEVFDGFRDQMPWDRMFAEPIALERVADAFDAMVRLDPLKPVIYPQLEATA